MKSVSEKRGLLVGWTTRDLLVAAAISVVIGLLLLPVLYVGHAMMAVTGPFITAVEGGLWLIPGIMIPSIIRRPGAAFLGCALVGLIEGPFSPFGWIILVNQIIVGIVCELPFLVARYRYYQFAFLLFVGVFASLGSLLCMYLPYGYAHLALSVQIAMMAGNALGGLLGAVLAKLLTDALAKTGVLNSFAIGRERVAKV